jgi:hypothetical protein
MPEVGAVGAMSKLDDQAVPASAGEPKFYKYMSAGTATVVLKNATLRWSTPRTFNDPLDVQFDLHVDVDRVSVKALALEKMWDAHYGENPAPAGNDLGVIIQAFRGRFPKWDRERFALEFGPTIDKSIDDFLNNLPCFHADVRELMVDSKILCLTTNPANDLMWTHYGDQHRGVALRFRTVPGLDSPWTEARPINYVRDLPLLMDEEFMSDAMAGRVRLDGVELSRRLVYTKSKSYEYEQEWRIYSGAGRNPAAPYEDLGFSPLELDAIIFGCRTTAADRDMIRDMVRPRYPHAEILKAELIGTSFGLEIMPL